MGSSTAVATLAALEKPNEMAMMKSIKGLAAAADRIQARKAQRGDIAKSNLASIERSRGDIKGFAMDAYDGSSYGEDFDVDFDGAREAAFAAVSVDSEGDGKKKTKEQRSRRKQGEQGRIKDRIHVVRHVGSGCMRTRNRPPGAFDPKPKRPRSQLLACSPGFSRGKFANFASAHRKSWTDLHLIRARVAAVTGHCQQNDAGVPP